ncbi:MAG TPA: ChbG/HpnK family deacetylase [Candidatus Wallbacteria bacterium]|nr:ChbG/HpnK family deacetylase [Candidatus Wallbacteria bacterium]
MKLIFNADDFGITDAVSAAICDLMLRSATLKSTTVMINLLSARSLGLAKDTLAKRPGLSFGLHFNLTCGRPVAPPDRVGTLINRATGEFLKFKDLVLSLIGGKVDPSHIENEFKAQIDLFRQSFGLPPSHIDSHKHMHSIPPIFNIVVENARKYGVFKVRMTENISAAELFISQGIEKKTAETYFEKRFKSHNSCYKMSELMPQASSEGDKMRFPKLFFGTYSVGRLSPEVFEAEVASRASEDVSAEYMVHPGSSDAALEKLSSLLKPRDSERDALASPGLYAVIKKHGIEIISYNAL